MSLESRAFDLAYERTCRQMAIVHDAERFRQLRVHALMLEEDRDDLHTQLKQASDRIDGLMTSNEQLEENLEVCGNNLESAEEELRIKLREINTMKVLANMGMVESLKVN